MNNFTKKISFRELIQLIESRTHLQAKRTTSGYILRCPAHNDKNPSLSIKEIADSKLLMFCFAGCSFKEICLSLGLSKNQG